MWAIHVICPCSDGAPQRCQWMPLCSVALSPHAKYLIMAFEKIHRIPIPPHCHLSTFYLLRHLPTASLLSHRSLSPRPGPLMFFAWTQAPAASSTWTTSRWPSRAAFASGPSPQRAPLMATVHTQRHRLIIFRLKHPSETCLKTKSSLKWIGKLQLCTYNNLPNLKSVPSQVSAFFVDLLQALGVHLQQASDSSDVAFSRSLQDVSASKRPKLWMSGWQSKFYSLYIYIYYTSGSVIIA